jgi:hypothetical protein
VKKHHSVLGILLLLLGSTSAFATGGTTCTDRTGLRVSLGQGHVIGAPLISDVFLTKGSALLTVYPRRNVVNYWVDSDQLKIRATDNQALEQVLYVNITGIVPRGGNDPGWMTLRAKLSNGYIVTRNYVRVYCQRD